MTTPKLRLAVLISGGGTTLQNLVDRQRVGQLPAEIVQVISSKDAVQGLERAAAAQIACEVITRRACRDRTEFSDLIFAKCRQVGAELVALAGFLEFLPIPTDFMGKVMNIHPALLPAFGGKGMYGHHVHAAVLAAGVKVSGCTVHFVNNEYDQGPIIIQRAVPVLEEDEPATLAARVFAEECIAYPQAIQLQAEGRLRIEGRRVRVMPPTR